MAELATLTKQGSVGVITLNNPPVNVLSHAMRVALRDSLEAAVADSSIEAILLLCEGRTFVAGADIREFDTPAGRPDVNEIVELVGACKKPITAAIHGTALGGGVELALACQFRLATPDAQLGFPEVNLGILPGAGGTQRLPRLVGVPAALELIVGGSSIGAPKALEIGLIDELTSSDLRAEALAFVERKLAERKPWTKISERQVAAVEPATFEAFEAGLADKARGFLAPFACIKAIRAAAETSFQEGLAYERQLFLQLVSSSQSKAQRHAFFGEREVSRSPRLARDVRPKEVRSVAVVGSDDAAVQMAKRFADRRMPVTLVTSSERVEQMATQTQATNIRVSAAHADVENVDFVVLTGSGDALGNALVELDAVCPSDTVFAIVAGEVNVREAAAPSKHPERVLGLNFEGRGLMEVIATSDTGPTACATAMGLSKPLRKVAVLEKADRGSAAQRLRDACQRDARTLVERGVSTAALDSVLSELGGSSLGGQAKPSVADADGTAPEREMLVERCLATLANEGAMLLDEGVLIRPLEVDMIAIHGHGFPVYWGGPLFRADQVGVRTLYERLNAASSAPAKKLATLFEKLGREGRGFYS